MNVVSASGDRQPSDQASRLGLWVRRKLAAIIHIHHRHCYYHLGGGVISPLKCITDVWKILESACMNSWSPRDQRVNLALFGAHSRKYMRGLWSENIVASVAKTKFLNFRKWVKWALIPIFVTRRVGAHEDTTAERDYFDRWILAEMNWSPVPLNRRHDLIF